VQLKPEESDEAGT